MADANELRAAAERLMSHDFDRGGIDSFAINDLVMPLARGYLAEHPADDSEPICIDWIMSLSAGPIDMSSGDDLAVAFCNGWQLHRAPNETRWSFWRCAGCFLRMVDDRGDVRRLMSALGAELKERTNDTAE